MEQETSDLDPEIIYSSLCQPIERDGKQVQVLIYGDDEGGWLLEIEDEHRNSTVWSLPFATEQAALDEALAAAEKDGIDSLIGPPPATPALPVLDNGLSVAELDELDSFLGGDAIASTSMDVSALEGFLTAIAIGPRLVSPSEWLPLVWDMEQGTAAPHFATNEQASRIIALLMRAYNGVLDAFAADPASFGPLFLRDARYGPEQWCEGFLVGVKLDLPAWRGVIEGHTSWFLPIMKLGITDDGEGIASANDVQAWMNGVVPSLALIHGHWKAATFGSVPMRAGPKVGRNDPCPCGSGKKFKKCCGAE